MGFGTRKDDTLSDGCFVGLLLILVGFICLCAAVDAFFFYLMVKIAPLLP